MKFRRISVAHRPVVPQWLIPMVYIVGSVIAGALLPRFEYAYLPTLRHGMSVASALAYFSAVASGMMGFTGIVFAIAFVVVQFSASAYSPRLTIVFASSPTLAHALGIFFATFIYSLAALVWTDRGGSGTAPLLSALLVSALLILSMLAFARLIHSLTELQVHRVLQLIGAHGRRIIQTRFPLLGEADSAAGRAADREPLDLGPPTQTVVYSGEPLTVAEFDHDALLRLAQSVDGVIAIQCAVGETLVADAPVLHVLHSMRRLPETSLLSCFHLSSHRTLDQDPKYAIRLLVDIAIKALSPAINDPTTAVQAIDQIEDLLRRLGKRQLEAGSIHDAAGTLRLTFPVPTWQDYLALSFDEIRQYGITSVQVDRRLRAALVGLFETLADTERRDAVKNYIDHLKLDIRQSTFDDQDRVLALQEDRQGLGLPRRTADVEQ